jgi:hypothetical protein
MPEMDAGRRASGGWMARRVSPRQHYTKDQLGGLCQGCGNPIPAALAGMLTHPTCDPEFPALNVSLKRALARRRATTPPEEQ